MEETHAEIRESWDSSVGIATGYGMDGQSSISGKGKRFVSIHSIQTGSETHPAS
jgi:hypothetical protein